MVIPLSRLIFCSPFSPQQSKWSSIHRLYCVILSSKPSNGFSSQSKSLTLHSDFTSYMIGCWSHLSSSSLHSATQAILACSLTYQRNMPSTCLAVSAPLILCLEHSTWYCMETSLKSLLKCHKSFPNNFSQITSSQGYLSSIPYLLMVIIFLLIHF